MLSNQQVVLFCLFCLQVVFDVSCCLLRCRVNVGMRCCAQSLLAGTALTCLLLTLVASAFGAAGGVLGCSGMVAL